MINQNFRPAGAHWPSSVACYRYCRRGDRLNPFNDDAQTTERPARGTREGGSLSGTTFLGPARERGDPCSDKACPVFPSLLPISFRSSLRLVLLSLSLSFLLFEREIDGRRLFRKFVSRWCNGHNARRGKRCVSITIDPDRGESYKTYSAKEWRKNFNSRVSRTQVALQARLQVTTVLI